MKVAILSESAADEAALRVLVDGILGAPTERVPLQRFEHRRGWPNLLAVAPVVFRYLHYQTDADALVVVADSNGTPLHRPGSPPDEQCRLCKLHATLRPERLRVAAVRGRAPLRTAIGLACPAIEAWYQCGVDPHATEVAWARDLAGGVRPAQHVQKLKLAVYSTDRPSLAMEVAAATQAARRLVQDLTGIEGHFPIGFGLFMNSVRAWCEGSP
jgi:hypothetical protein